jgi:hypothetical protein
MLCWCMEHSKFKHGDKVRVSVRSVRHAGKIGYIDSFGFGPSEDTVILCSVNRHNGTPIGPFKDPLVVIFAVFTKDIEIIT